MTGETPRRTKRKERRNSAKGGHSSSSKVRGGYDIEPYSIYKGEEEEVLLERPEREFEDESASLMEMSSIVVSLRMVDTLGILTKGL